MDTPERNKINTPLSKFENSPVFNYISNLSPIKPVKSVHVTQTLNSLSHSSPPSVFTTPHVNCHRESRFLRRHNLLDTSKLKFSPEEVRKIYSHEVAPAVSTHAHHESSNGQQHTDQRVSIGDSSIEPSSERTKFSVDLPQTLKYNSGCPGYDPLLCGYEAYSLLELLEEPASDVGHLQEGSDRYSVEGEMHLQGGHLIEAKTEGPDCDWDNFITDASDLLTFSSSNVTEALMGLMNKQLYPPVQLGSFPTLSPQSTGNNDWEMPGVNPGSEHEIEDYPSEPTAATDTGLTQDNLANVALMASIPSEKMDDELVYVTHRAIRRRCLDFEMASMQRKNSGDSSNISSSIPKSDERNVGNEKRLLPTKHTGDSQILPGIGLHLNVLAPSKDYEGIKNEMMSSGREPNHPSSTSSLHLSASQEHHLSLVPASMKRDLEPSENEVQPAEDCTQSSVSGEDFHQKSPKKKRRKSEPGGEGGSCKRCRCKKSKCLKLYCECFSAGAYCMGPCLCQDCGNKPIHVDHVLQTRKQIKSRNPNAFTPKVIRSSDSASENGDDPNKTPASARHKRGCNCKKSSCQKKYCECYQGGVGCSINCRCEGCKNSYGRKDGSTPIDIQVKSEKETGAREKGVVEKASQKTEIQNIEDHPDRALHSTPSGPSRLLLPLPSSSNGKAPRSFVTTVPSSGLFANQKLGLNSQSKFEKPSQTVIHDDDSHVTCIKTCSPNGKRISSSNCDFGSSPPRRGSRRLILQSIPSFPSLNPDN